MKKNIAKTKKSSDKPSEIVYSYKKCGYEFTIDKYGMICATDEENNGIIVGIESLIEFINLSKDSEKMVESLRKATIKIREFRKI